MADNMGIAVLTGFGTGALALVGAFVGALMTRRSEYERWYRQVKSEALAEFLRQLWDTRIDVSDAYYSGQGDGLSRSVKAGEAFVRLEKYAGIARLYMSPSARVTLADWLNTLRVECTGNGGPARSSKAGDIMKDLQALLETEFSEVPKRRLWLF